MIYNNLHRMKKFISLAKTTASVMILLTCVLINLSAQSKSNKKSKKEEPSFSLKEKLWYGGSMNLVLTQTTLGNTNIPGNVFKIGISPMVGYKFTSYLSAGPRFAIDFTSAKFKDFTEIYKYQATNFDAGLFTRFKFLKILFLHGEFSRSSKTYATGINPSNNRIETERKWRNNLYLGLGYNSNSIAAYEFYALYNFLNDPNSEDLPFDIRFGITYNF